LQNAKCRIQNGTLGELFFSGAGKVDEGDSSRAAEKSLRGNIDPRVADVLKRLMVEG